MLSVKSRPTQNMGQYNTLLRGMPLENYENDVLTAQSIRGFEKQNQLSYTKRWKTITTFICITVK